MSDPTGHNLLVQAGDALMGEREEEEPMPCVPAVTAPVATALIATNIIKVPSAS